MNPFDVFGEIEIQSIPQQIANAVKQYVYDGKLKPGDSIPKQEDLAQMFGVSRPTIREALKILEDSQLVVPKTGRDGGYRIADFHPEKALKNVRDMIALSLAFQTLTPWDLFEVRKMIEIPCAALAATRRTEEDLLQLEQFLPSPDIMNRHSKEIIEKDLHFHMALSECTHNPLAKTLMSAIVMSFSRIPVELNKENKMYIVADLPKVFQAVKDQDAEKAKQCMEDHLNYFVHYFQL